MAYLSLRNATLTTSSINVSSLNMNTAQFSTLTSNYSILNNTGLNLSTINTAITITGATYSTSTLLAVLSFSSTTSYPSIGAWVTVASVTPSGYNGSFLVTASSSTSITVQNYTGTTLTYSSGGTITINSAGSAGLTFGDTTTMVTHRAPIVSYITTSSAVTGTPLAVANTYTTPIGAKYLKIRMVGAGGGGSNWNVANAAGGVGGNTTFTGTGTLLIAYGGCSQPNTGMSYFNTPSTYPMTYLLNGAAGGGILYIASYVSNGSNSYTITLCSATTAICPQLVTTNNYLTGTTISLVGFQTTAGYYDQNWNKVVTITSYTATTVTFTASTTLSAPVAYGVMVLNSPNSTTLVSAGQTGCPSTNVAGLSWTQGGLSMLGTALPLYPYSQNLTLNLSTNPVICPSGAPFYGGGGCGAGDNTNVGGSGIAGGAGQYIETYISAPATSYTYTLGAGGQGGIPDGARGSGGTGGNGLIIVEAYF